MSPIVIEIAGEPRGKGRPRFARSGHTYTPAATRAYEFGDDMPLNKR